MVETKIDIQLRPRIAAKRIGISQSTFWKLAKNDPLFPKLTRIGKRCTSISAAALDEYIARKTGAA